MPDRQNQERAALSVALRVAAGAEDLPLPEYKTAGAAGMDLYAAVREPIIIEPGRRAAVPTGIHIAIPEGYEAQVRPRSGLARNYGIGMVNSPGTIDADYRGEIAVLLINHGDAAFTVQRGDRIAQLVVAPVARVCWEIVEQLDETLRNDAGFGHTGRR